MAPTSRQSHVCLAIFSLAVALCIPVWPSATGDRVKADRLYYDDLLAEALVQYEAVLAEHPDDALVAYRVQYCLDQLPGREAEAELARQRALELLEREVETAPDPAAVYYLGVLIEESDPERYGRLWQAEVDRHLPLPDPALGAWPAIRLALMARHIELPDADVARLFEFALGAEDGGWAGAPWLWILTDSLHDVADTPERLESFSAHLDRGVERHPQSIRLLLARASFAQEADRTEAVQRDLDAALALGVEAPKDLIDAGTLLYELDRDAEAVGLLERAVGQAPYLVHGWRMLGQALYYSDRDGEAVEAYRRALALDPEQSSAEVMLGHALDATSQDDEAEAAYRRALELDPGRDWMRRSLADFLADRDREEEALAILDAPGLEGEPSVTSLTLRVRCLRYLDRPDEAIAAADAALESHPEHARLHHYRGRAFEDRGGEGDLVTALAAYERAIEIDPELATAHDEFATLLAADPEDSDAIEQRARIVREFEGGARPLELDAVDTAAIVREFDPADALYGDQDAAYLLDHLQVEILDDGRTIETYHGLMAILTDEAVEMFGELRLPFDAVNGRFEVHLARTHLTDGTVVDAAEEAHRTVAPADTETANLYSDTQIRVISLPAVRPGAVLEWRYTQRKERSLFDRHWWYPWAFDGYLPVGLSRFTIKIPDGVAFRHRASNGAAEPEVVTGDGHRLFRWSSRNRPPLPDEPGAPPMGDRHARLEITSMQSWDEVGSWYRGLARERYLDAEPARALLTGNAALESAESASDRVRAIVDHVRSHVRYVGIEFGVGGYQPRPAAETWQTGYGDCKDQATLLISLLRSQGFEAWPVLVRVDSRGEPGEWLPSPGVFNHAIVYLPGLGDGTFVDPTPSFLDFDLLSAEVQGAPALLVTDEGVQSMELPVQPASSNLFRTVREIDMSDPARVGVRDTSTVTGLFGQIVRATYGTATREEANQILADDILSDFPDAFELSMDVSRAMGVDGPPQVVQTFVVPGMLQLLGNDQHLLSLTGFGQLGDMLVLSPPEEPRRTDYVIPFRVLIEYETALKLPDGFELASSPPAIDLKNSVGSLSKRTRPTESGFVVEMRLEVGADRVAVGDYADLLELVRVSRKNATWNLLLDSAATASE